MMFKSIRVWVVVVAGLLAPAGVLGDEGEGDAWILATINEVNGVLRAEWMDLRAEWMDQRIAVQQVEVLRKGAGSDGARLFRRPFRWVAGDARRAADGENLTYMVDREPVYGLPDSAEPAIDRAASTWQGDSCLSKIGVVKRPAGADADLFDARFGYGPLGDFRLADVVHAGWMPPDFFEQVTGPGGGTSVVALSVTFVFVDIDGVPSDVDGDGYLDTAHNEIYYNAAFFERQGIDLESVALHELGHSLALGHMGPPPEAVMNPIYSGVRREPGPLDHAALCGVWKSWPK
jgi:hypothetical protein